MLDPDLLDGLLLSAVLGRQSAGIFWSEQSCSEYRNAEENLETGHLHLQRTQVVLAHDHHTKQICQALPRWQSALFTEVRSRNACQLKCVLFSMIA